MKDKWSSLSMKEKNEYIKVAVNNGITDLDSIRSKYNSFAEGGNIETEKFSSYEVPKYESEYQKKRNVESVVDSYIDNVLWDMENPKHEGFNYVTGTYKPYDDGASQYNLGPGLNKYGKSGKVLDFSGKKRYTKEELDSVAREELISNMENIMSDLYDMYGEDADTMSLGNKMILLDIAHNVRPHGSKRKNMPKAWPSLVKGMMAGDEDKVRANTYSGSTRRQNMRNELMFLDKVDGNTIDSNKFEEGGPIIFDNKESFTGTVPVWKYSKQAVAPLNFSQYINVQPTEDSQQRTVQVPKGNPSKEFVNRVNSVVEPKTQQELLTELESKDINEVLSLQKELANAGYYDIDLNKGRSKNAVNVQNDLVEKGYLSGKDVDGIIGKQSISALQQMLVDKGYLNRIASNGKSNVDGVIGKNTREAFKRYNRDLNVNGVIDTRTREAYLKNSNKDFSTYVSAEGMQGKCAGWVTKKFDDVTGASKQNGVCGNAWTMMKNVEDAGGQMLFNIYENPEFSDVENAKDIKKATEKSLKNTNLDYSQLQPGDIVGIYIPSSNAYGEVLKEGTTYNTHVGIVSEIKDGVPVVEHNIGGKVRKENINNITGTRYGKAAVTVASRPKYEGKINNTLSFNPDIKSSLSIDNHTPNEHLQEYMNSLASSKETLRSIYDESEVDLDFIEKAALAITKRETGFMENKQSDVKENWNKGIREAKDAVMSHARDAAHVMRNAKEKYDKGKIPEFNLNDFKDLSGYMKEVFDVVTDVNDEIISQDLTKMKFNSLPKAYRDAIGLTSPEQLSTDPTITGRAVSLLLAKNYEYFTRLSKKYPELGLTKEDIENAVIKSYNTGMASLYSLGFDNETGKLDKEEVEKLRRESAIGAKEKNVNATNWKYLGDIGEWLYDRLASPHTPYVSAARNTMSRIKSN